MKELQVATAAAAAAPPRGSSSSNSRNSSIQLAGNRKLSVIRGS
jgi:hypothetical protein